ncbi:hypothetical protein J6590_033660 [Homalodisca vitripennis]|nr:hypothetical protein J6590_033660 [Homalodisca vitripennis]
MIRTAFFWTTNAFSAGEAPPQTSIPYAYNEANTRVSRALCRCYVGSADRDQWRPCSEHYFPYFPNVQDRPMHWPVAYLHREGPPNMTIPQHQPSIVDNFLQTLRETENQLFGPVSQKGNNSVPEFQVVELKTEQPKDSQEEGNAMAKLWTWGQSKYNGTNQGTVTKVEVNSNNSTS